jgi:hypothetical protein
MDNFFLSYAEQDMEELEADLLVPGREQSAFIMGYRRAISTEVAMEIHVALTDAHPKAQAKEQAALRRPMLLKSGLEALKKWRQEAMDASLPPAGKNRASLGGGSFFSPLTQEEKADIRDKVKEANPGATGDKLKSTRLPC